MMKTRTNWEKLSTISDEDIDAAISQDSDAYAPTEKELKRFKRVNPVQSINVKKVRKDLRLSQAKFALYFGVNVRTIQEWEQGRSIPSQLARNFLRVVQHNPVLVQQALQIEGANSNMTSKE